MYTRDSARVYPPPMVRARVATRPRDTMHNPGPAEKDATREAFVRRLLGGAPHHSEEAHDVDELIDALRAVFKRLAP
jgi:hypothetical protein